MNLDSLSFTLSQISYLVANLSKKNYKQSTQELVNLVQVHGLEADRHLLRCLFSHVDFSVEGRNSSGSNKDLFQVQLLTNECNSLLFKPALISLLCYAFDHPLHQQKTLKPTVYLFAQLKKLLKLTPVQEVVFGLALEHSSNPELQKLANQFVRLKLPELVNSYVDAESSRQHEGGLHDTTPEVLHLILTSLTQESAPALWKRVQRDFPREHVPVVLSPLLYPTITDPTSAHMDQSETSHGSGLLDAGLASLVPDVGATFTSSLDKCKTMVNNLTGGELSPANVAHTITAMLLSPPVDANHANYFDKLDKSGNTNDTQWNIEIFIMAVKELHPNMAWRDVVAELDNPKFLIKDRHAFHQLVTSLRICFDKFSFPIDLFYRRWNNADGQYSLILQILKNPETFSFADYPFHQVPVESLKASADSDNKEIATWRSQDLIEILLVLGEHHRLYTQVIELFKFPIQHCPDVLMLGLLQNNAPLSGLRQELVTSLIPTFLGIHHNSTVILHQAWNHSAHIINVRSIIMACMAEWYLRCDNDQARLSRILDIAQDLKALTLILASQVLPFVIDLACLASRRGYLKLDKWLSDKIREHGESFISACVTFLQRRCPQITGQGKEDVTPKGAQLPHETLTTVLSCLQACAASVSKELSDAILAMIANCTLLASKARQPAGVLRHRTLEPFAAFPSSQQLDPLSGLTTALQGMGIVPSMNNMSGGLGSLVPTPASPSRMLPTSQSPFPVFINQALQHPSGASQVVPGVGVPRVPAQGMDKINVGATMFGEHMKPIPKEVEDEANSYFQRIYNHPPHPTLSIEEVLEMLKKFMESSKPRERDVFNCMIKNLFEEYQFFPQYPEKELFVTAQLFGGIIEQGLMNNYMALGLALRFVLDALRKQHGSKMYYFGITALDRFKTKLKDWAKYCEHVASIPHFREFPPHLIAYVDFGLQSQEPPNPMEGPVLPPQLASLLQQPQKTAVGMKIVGAVAAPSLTGSKTPALSGRPSIANATNIDTLLMATEKEEKMTIPPETFQDKISFIFNNLSQLNLPTKSEELRDMIKKEYFPWIAQYLVLKRVTIELNFHVLYSSVLDILKHPDLNRLVLRETYRNIRVLLRSDKGIANFSDRSLLKNLGHWLGMQTLAKNKPILMLDIDLKSLIIEAYTKGQQELLYVIPFVAKVMESCAKSKVFRPKNPWTMAVMNLLAELHREPDLKLNLKFEIEVLCKALDTEVAKLTPTLLLKDPKWLEAIEKQLSKPDDEISVTPHTTQHVAVAPPPPPPAPKPIQQNTEELQHIPTPNTIIFNSVTNPNAITPLPVPPGTPNPNTANTPAVPAPVEPRFHVMDLNVASFSNLPQHMISIPQLTIFRDYPQLKSQVRSAIEQAVQEWDQPVTERSIKIAATTTEYVVRRDFAVDFDETRLRMAAHTLVRCLTGSMAMMTCRDHMQASICTNLKAAFTTHLHGASKMQLEQAEAAAAAIAEANMDVACAFIQKAAIEKAIPEIDKRLNEDYELRKIARSEGRRYCDTSMLTYQAERMPEAIRHPVGGASNSRIQSVYGECGKTVPGFHPLTDHEAKLLGQKDALPSNLCFPEEEIIPVYDKLVVDLEMYLQTALSSGTSNPRVLLLHALREAALIARRMRDPTSALPLLQKAVEGLFDGLLQREDHEGWVRNRDAYLRVLKTFHEARIDPQWTVKNVTRCLLEAREEIRYNLDVFDCLVRSGLIYLPQFDEYLGQVIETSINYTPIMFAMQLIQVYLIDERGSPVLCETDLQNSISSLVRLHALRRDVPPGLSGLLDLLRAVNDPITLGDQPASGAFANIHAGILLARNRDFEDSLPERCEFLLREWVSTYTPAIRDQSKSFNHIIQQMNYAGLFKSEDMIAKFIRISAEICVLNCSRAATDNSGRIKCYYTLDAFVRLIYLLIKHLGDVSAPVPVRLSLMNKTLGIITGLLLMDHDNRTNEFNQMPYERLYVMLFLELTQPEPYLEAINFQILTSFCHVFHLIRPAKAPKFAYAWLELIAHRSFITRVMALTPQQKGWPLYSQLLTALFKFLAPFLRNTDLPKAVGMLYRGTLRVLLVLLHDFPEFLCDYHYGFCDVIPSNCIQMRNLILSAFPRNMRLPDPFTPNLKVEILTEIAAAPRVVSNVASMITPPSFRKDLDSYLKLRAPVTFLSELRSNLQVSNEPGMSYNTQLMNALVLYVGTQAIQYIRSKGLAPNMSTIASSAHMDIFQNLGVDLDTEGRYLFLNAIANQLRYPNSHTHYFSCLLLSLFAESNTESIQEQITRVLLERLIVNRPHPWGLLITFIELIKNPIYKFWSHEFVHCAPEIEKLFESVARSCMVPKQVNQQNDNDTGEALAV